MAKAGRLGKKNRKGFFKYDAKTGRNKGVDQAAYGFFKGNGSKEIETAAMQDRPIMLMLNEAVMSLEDGIISSSKDGDLGAVFGIGFLPFTGGPFRAMDTWGVKVVYNRMKEFEAKYGARFKPAALLAEMAEKGAQFH